MASGSDDRAKPGGGGSPGATRTGATGNSSPAMADPGSSSSAADLLERIVASKQAEIAELRPPFPTRRTPIRPFADALRRPSGAPLRVIAECKKASPSKGLMRPDYRPADIARQYASLGAAAISVLTDGPFFSGSADHIALVREAAAVPVLRKDFTVDAVQIEEAHSLEADAILLIVRLLTPAKLRELLATAEELGLDALVETHNAAEVETALDCGATLIGINHRDLDTLQMDLSLTERLAPRIRGERPEAVIIAESGVETRDGRKRMEAHADAILAGTAFMQAADIGAVWREVFAS